MDNSEKIEFHKKCLASVLNEEGLEEALKYDEILENY